MDIFVGVVVGLVVLTILVILHELGHFIAARRSGVRVLEFGIGFPPRAIAWVKDKKTGKWRRLLKSEWEKDQMAKVVGMGKEEKSALAERGLIFSINWIPIGGFCQMDGESAWDERPGTFGKASYLKKTKILFAGVAMNWLTAFIILTILAWTGMPEFLEGQFTVAADSRREATPVQIMSVAEGSPADKAGMLAEDYILAVDGTEMLYTSEITDYNDAHAGETVTYTVRRTIDCAVNASVDECVIMGIEEDGTAPTIEIERDLVATLNPAGSDYLLGVTMASTQALTYSTWSAPIVGAGVTLQLTGETFAGMGQLVWNLFSGVGQLFSLDSSVRENGQQVISSVGDSVSGPIGIIGVLFPSFTAAGPTNLAFLVALISVSLACMNVLPIPALDGGRWFLITLFKIRKKRLTKELEQKIVARAFIVLLVILAIVTILDITRLF